MDDLHDAEAWIRATRAHPCPICGKPDWCTFTKTIALCMRTESTRPSRGDAGGWLHELGERPRQSEWRRLRVRERVGVDFESLADEYQDALDLDGLGVLSRQLGVSTDALELTGVGWCAERQAWSWPMYDHEARVVGVRLRDARTSSKYAVPGSREGVFMGDCPKHSPPPVLVTEGPTDLCAGFDIGFTAIGRPSCTGGTKQLVRLLRSLDVVVVADRDGPGLRGADALASVLLPGVRSLRIISPPAPHKDLRAWLLGGADQAVVQAVIDAVPAQTMRWRIVR
jgi:hypothetical protein